MKSGKFMQLSRGVCRILAPVIVLLVAGSLFASTGNSKRGIHQEEVRFFNFTDDNGVIRMLAGNSEMRKYDRKGNLVEETRYDNKKNLVQQWTHVYNPDGTKFSDSRKYGNGQGSHCFYTSICDRNGRVVEEKCFASGWKHISTTRNRYDEKGRLLELVHFADGRINHRERYEYGPDGNISIKVIGSGNDIVHEKWVFEYQGNRVSKQTVYKGEGSIKWRRTFAYITGGCETETEAFDLSGMNVPSNGTSVQTFDARGNVIRDVFRREGKAVYCMETTYTYFD